jgi:SP family sugar:H+ symporter-like MFS transporter
LFGYDTGTINGIKDMKDWLRTFGKPTTDLTNHPTGYHITSSQESLVVSILSAGTFCGALLAAPAADLLGRRAGIIFAALVFSVGVAMQTASTKLPLFIVGRVIAGLGVGLVSCLVPMYQSECAPKWIRGAVVSMYQWAITIGLLLSAIVNNATQNRNNHSAYRLPISIQFIWAFILASGMLFLPESPRWLIKRGNMKGAEKSMGRLLSLPEDDPVVQQELEIIRDNLEEEKATGESSYLDCFKPSKNRIGH